MLQRIFCFRERLKKIFAGCLRINGRIIDCSIFKVTFAGCLTSFVAEAFNFFRKLFTKNFLLFSVDPQTGVDEDDSEDTGSSRAQYVSANCVVFTHYQGDAASVVDEHFSRALDKTAHGKGITIFFYSSTISFTL